MKTIRILNAYAGIGGNRKLWPERAIIKGQEYKIQIDAVEHNPEIARIYADNFPYDRMYIEDAHEFLIDHFLDYNFIWTSRPCQSHSRANAAFNAHGKQLYCYPDMILYSEIIFLNHFCKAKYVVENVIPYYKPLIKPTAIRDRHFFWSNFFIPSRGRVASCEDPIEFVKSSKGRYGFDISKYKLSARKTQILRNCVNPELGLYIFNCAFKEKQATLCSPQVKP